MKPTSPESPNPQGGTLLEYVRVARRRGWVILLTAILAGGGGYLVARRGVPVYQAQAEVLLRGTTAADAAVGQPSGVVADVTTELRVLEGYAVRQAVLKALPGAAGISGTSVTSANSFTIRVASSDPRLASASANAYANAYIAERRASAVDDLLAVTQQVQTRITDLQRQIDGLGPPDTAPLAGRPLSDVEVQRAALESQQSVYRIQSNVLQLQLAKASPGALLLTPATPSASPVAPRPRQTAAEAAAGGLVVGLGLAFLLEYMDDTVTTTEALTRLTGGHPVLGVIPTVPGWRNREQAQVTTLKSPSSRASEAFRYLRTSVRFLGLDRAVKVIHITSPASRDGKTTIVANLGVVLAQVGERVLIIDLDLRRPRVHEFFGLPNDVGFTSVVLGEAPLTAAIQPVIGVAGLSVLSSGAPPPNPSEVLSSARTVELLATLRAGGWTIVLDSPPVLPVTDASVVSTLADATLLVTSVGLTKKHHVKRAVDLLRQVQAPFAGTVLNRASTHTGDEYGYTATEVSRPRPIPPASTTGPRPPAAPRTPPPEAQPVQPLVAQPVGHPIAGPVAAPAPPAESPLQRVKVAVPLEASRTAKAPNGTGELRRRRRS